MSNVKKDKAAAIPTMKANSSKKPSQRSTEKDSDVGKALRTIYQKTIDESVPQEMLDLLGKLG